MTDLSERRRPVTHIWLDLEGTLIESWWKPDFLYDHARCIRRAVQDERPATLNIFSFALHEPRERQRFNNEWRPGIEKFFGMPFTVVPTVLDFQKALGRITHGSMPKRDTVLLEWGKWRTFEAMVLDDKDATFRGGLHEDVRCILFDDDVSDLTLQDRRSNIIIQSVNINMLVADSLEWLKEG